MHDYMPQANRRHCRNCLKKRIGSTSPENLAKIAVASHKQIDAWLDQMLVACSLNNLFG